ncbi:T-cell immunoglobulin and mucin domain-containing protein 4-like isoform X3 [Parambassis ranga]|uniref:T-cell immunoglobulin and mucin domain-containing protein 4-like isoform X3 n=1 Tax=Parambassis ranga TaxID=210632 RepID=UPI001041BE00|nr:T-cell immunoglobulin and mucin domain-containing protein 4-like isoform X3 [Parambassis ranga]
MVSECLCAPLVGGGLVCVCDSRTVTGQTGQSATLPCTYDVKTDGALHVCWGRGQIPIRGCSQQLIATDGRQVTQSLSDRFQLLGQLDRGNVSLTIHNITEADAGQYGCRAEVPGWFNDAKHQVELVVLRAPHTTPWTPPATPPATPAGTTATSQTAGHMTSTQTLRTSRSSGIKSAERHADGGSGVCSVGFGGSAGCRRTLHHPEEEEPQNNGSAAGRHLRHVHLHLVHTAPAPSC